MDIQSRLHLSTQARTNERLTRALLLDKYAEQLLNANGQLATSIPIVMPCETESA